MKKENVLMYVNESTLGKTITYDLQLFVELLLTTPVFEQNIETL